MLQLSDCINAINSEDNIVLYEYDSDTDPAKTSEVTSISEKNNSMFVFKKLDGYSDFHAYTDATSMLNHLNETAIITNKEYILTDITLDKKLKDTTEYDWNIISASTKVPFIFISSSGGHGDYPSEVSLLGSTIFDSYRQGELKIRELLPMVRGILDNKKILVDGILSIIEYNPGY